MPLLHTIDLKCAIWVFNDPRIIKRCYNNRKLRNTRSFYCVHTGHCPGRTFLSKHKWDHKNEIFRLTIDMQQLVMSKIKKIGKFLGCFMTNKSLKKNRASRVDRPQGDQSLEGPINCLGAWRVCLLITFSIYLSYNFVILSKTSIKNKLLFRCPPGTSGIYSVKSPHWPDAYGL